VAWQLGPKRDFRGGGEDAIQSVFVVAQWQGAYEDGETVCGEVGWLCHWVTSNIMQPLLSLAADFFYDQSISAFDTCPHFIFQYNLSTSLLRRNTPSIE
ncbi:MAG: hypothetical protein D3909_13180, partial [Candidatus Electrothrix sp. ATG1]|nr:hypothetical protein [Candidatus Electrothrix sp. ATG1]